MPFVLDASAAAGLVFPDEPTDIRVEALINGDTAIVPAIWPYEVANALRNGARAGRVEAGGVPLLADQFASLPTEVVPVEAADIFDAVVPLALEAGLSVYDAAYLALAARRGLPLLTLDTRLRAAARARGIEVLPA